MRERPARDSAINLDRRWGEGNVVERRRHADAKKDVDGRIRKSMNPKKNVVTYRRNGDGNLYRHVEED